MIPPDRLLLLDTTVLIVLARGGGRAAYLDEKFGISTRTDVPLLSAISVGELHALARRNEWGTARIDRLRVMIHNLTVVGIRRAAIIDAYARIDADLTRAGQRMGQQNDMWIAATAAATDAVLLTTDQDFDVLHPSHITREYVSQDELRDV